MCDDLAPLFRLALFFPLLWRAEDLERSVQTVLPRTQRWLTMAQTPLRASSYALLEFYLGVAEAIVTVDREACFHCVIIASLLGHGRSLHQEQLTIGSARARKQEEQIANQFKYDRFASPAK
jgi:hypothetical protein